jgi:hypothetical protein
MKNIYKISATITLVVFMLSSCTKVIDIDLNSKSPQIVIEGNISNEVGPYEIKISKTVNFSETNIFPAVTDATVVISDDSGITDTLIQPSPGIYQTSKLMGTPGRTYTMKVNINDKSYVSICTMPTAIAIDSIYLTKNSFDFGSELKTVAVPIFTDKAGEPNYYRFVEYRNSKRMPFMALLDDKFSDGAYIENPLYESIAEERFVNDSLTVEMICLDKAVHEYFRSIPYSGGPVPANPNSNISGGCFGYFSAYTVSRKKIVIN